MSHISRIDLTRDFKAHREEFLDAITKVCEETAFSGGKYADLFDEEFAQYIGQQTLAVSVKTTAEPQGEYVVESDVNEIPLKIAIKRA